MLANRMCQKKSRKVLPLIEKMKILHLIVKEKMLRLLGCMVRTNLLSMKKGKEICAITKLYRTYVAYIVFATIHHFRYQLGVLEPIP